MAVGVRGGVGVIARRRYGESSMLRIAMSPGRAGAAHSGARTGSVADCRCRRATLLLGNALRAGGPCFPCVRCGFGWRRGKRSGIGAARRTVHMATGGRAVSRRACRIIAVRHDAVGIGPGRTSGNRRNAGRRERMGDFEGCLFGSGCRPAVLI